MRRLLRAVVVALAAAASACVSAQARGGGGGPALAPPEPPPHTILPVESGTEAAGPPVSPSPPVPAPSATRPPAPRAEKPPDKPAEKPDPAAEPSRTPTPAPLPPLQTIADTTEVERVIRARMTQASRDLGRTDYRALTAERRSQYDMAKRFLQQAEEALKAKNLVFAEQLADKAATLAAALAQK